MYHRIARPTVEQCDQWDNRVHMGRGRNCRDSRWNFEDFSFRSINTPVFSAYAQIMIFTWKKASHAVAISFPRTGSTTNCRVLPILYTINTVAKSQEQYSVSSTWLFDGNLKTSLGIFSSGQS